MALARIAFSFFVTCGCVAAASSNVVKVDGGQIEGITAGGMKVFKGIPFAAPPVGDLRWKPPQPVIAWTGVRNADKFSPQCVQLPFPTTTPYFYETAVTSFL